MSFYLEPLQPMCAYGDGRPAVYIVRDENARQVSRPLCRLHAERERQRLNTEPGAARPVPSSEARST